MQSPIQHYLERIVAETPEAGGEIASYIPELASADPDRFALCLATVDGQVYEVGSAGHRYSIQSISKPFTYALALHDQGAEAVARKVDVEPSGDAFNEISLDPQTGRPRNALINAGAITAASLVEGRDTDDRFERLREWFGRFAGRELGFDEGVFRSELDSAHRNRAIAHMLREFDILEGDPEEALELYIRQCALSTSTRDLALMAATLANAGTQPMTGERLLTNAVVEHVLSVMATCGMYDAAGDWLSSVGMPAKSGVSGGIIGVLPGQVGMAVFSPRLDPHGNSARGVATFERMSSEMEMHLMHVSRGSRSAIRSTYSLADAPSPVRRTAAEREVLDRVSDRCRVYELHGDLLFSGVESLVRRVVEDDPELAVFDFTRVGEIAAVGWKTLVGLRERLREAGAEHVTVDPNGSIAASDTASDTGDEGASAYLEDLASAIEWGENELLRRYSDSDSTPDSEREPGADAAAEHPLWEELDAAEAEEVRLLMERRRYEAGEVVLEEGSAFSGLHLIVEGRAAVRDRAVDGSIQSLAGLGPGASFGELALGTTDVQETEIAAVSALEVLVLGAEDLDRITRERPRLAAGVWKAVARAGYRHLGRGYRANRARTR